MKHAATFLIALLLPLLVALCAAEEPATIKFTSGSGSDFQALLDNTTRVLIENLTIANEKPLDGASVELRNDRQVVIRNATVKGAAENVAPVKLIGCTDVIMEHVTCNGAAVEKPAISTEKKKKNGSTKKKGKNQEPQPK